ncbi:Cysteine synthase 2 [Emydomyces testavorans]|uniref:Cysteine synthase 2 n=1 Tax=Emydomyces testavorans TaxID=2070801 RepID=A0AAF0DHM5_9EURO|nr:Cysteine synthase 2 [Emydomyces testavorans]
MPNFSQFYVPTVAFLAGAILAIGLKDFYTRKSTQRKQAIEAYEFATAPIPSGVSLCHHRPPPIVDGIEGCIGNTPLIRIKSLSDATECDILAKAEAEKQGLLVPHNGDAIYEGTVGSTGISLAMLARARGCMPSDQSAEKSNLLLRLGAAVDRVPPAPIVETGHFVNRARSLAASHHSPSETLSFGSTPLETTGKRGRGFFADQFENPANWQAHFGTTGPEILDQCKGRLDAFVSGAGTGGTISGVALYLKPRLPALKVVLADPQGSGLFNRIRHGVMFDTKEREGTRRRRQVDTIVEGIGLNRTTLNFEVGRELIDDAIRVSDAQATAMAKWLVEKDGIFVGSSSAVNCFAALVTAMKMGPGHRIVTILCDSGTRHLSKFWENAGIVGATTDTKLEDILAGTDCRFASNHNKSNT